MPSKCYLPYTCKAEFTNQYFQDLQLLHLLLVQFEN